MTRSRRGLSLLRTARFDPGVSGRGSSSAAGRNDRCLSGPRSLECTV